MKISEILWLAANKTLMPCHHSQGGEDEQTYFSCLAILNLKDYGVPHHRAVQAKEFYESLAVFNVGLTTFTEHVSNFLPYLGDTPDKNQTERQQIRYCWLMLASQIAEEEGL